MYLKRMNKFFKQYALCAKIGNKLSYVFEQILNKL